MFVQKIITDESVAKPADEEVTSDVLEVCTNNLERIVSTASTTQGMSCDYHVICGHLLLLLHDVLIQVS